MYCQTKSIVSKNILKLKNPLFYHKLIYIKSYLNNSSSFQRLIMAKILKIHWNLIQF